MSMAISSRIDASFPDAFALDSAVQIQRDDQPLDRAVDGVETGEVPDGRWESAGVFDLPAMPTDREPISGMGLTALLASPLESPPSELDKAWMLYESLTGPSIPRLPSQPSEADTNLALDQLSATLDARIGYYRQRMSELPEGRLQRHYGQLADALERDRNSLADANGLSTPDKAYLHNVVAQQVEIEVRYHVDLVDTSAKWGRLELDLVESALSKLDALSPAFTRENENLGLLFRVPELRERHGQERGMHPGNVVVISAATLFNEERFGVNLLERTLIEQVAAKLQLNSTMWNEFMSLSGWRDLGPQNRFPKLSTGDVSTADALGISDLPASTKMVVSKREGHTYAYPETPPVAFLREDAQAVAQSYPERFDDGTLTPMDDFMQSVHEYVHDPASTLLPAEKRDFIERLLKELNA